MRATTRRAAALAAALALASGGALAQQPQQPPQPQRPAAQAAPAVASPEVEAEHARGIELRRQHRDAEARDVFRALYERTHEPRALARQAAAEAAIGEWLTAEEHLAEALRAESDPWIIQNRAGLTQDLGVFREHLGLLEVASTTPGAELWIGGARRASLPTREPVRVRAGAVTYEVRARGYATEVNTTSVPGGMRFPIRESVDLTALPPGAAPPPVGSPPPPPPVVPPPTPWATPLRIVGVSLLGASAVAAGVGVVGLVSRNHQADVFNQDPACGVTALTPGACQNAYDAGQRAATLATVGFVAAGAFAVAGVVLLALPSRTARTRSTLLQVAPGAGAVPAGLTLSGRF